MIIAVTGLAGSGKTTVAEHLIEKHGYVRHKFAKPLKDMCRALGMTEEMIEGDLKEVPLADFGGKTSRYIMQTLGTEWGRNIIDNDLWVKAWENTLPSGDVVVDDCRFLNEAAAVKRLGGKTIKVERPGIESGEHQSETEMSQIKYDFAIENDFGIPELKNAVDMIMEKWV